MQFISVCFGVFGEGEVFGITIGELCLAFVLLAIILVRLFRFVDSEGFLECFVIPIDFLRCVACEVAYLVTIVNTFCHTRNIGCGNAPCSKTESLLKGFARKVTALARSIVHRIIGMLGIVLVDDSLAFCIVKNPCDFDCTRNKPR